LKRHIVEKKRQAWAKIVENEIAQTAARLFVQKGYNQTTMDDIADAIGTSKANLYNYVVSKYALMLTILEHHIKLVADVFNKTDNLPGDIAIWEKLQQLIWDYAKVVDECQNEAITLHHAVVRVREEDKRKFLKSAVWVFEYFEELLKQGIKSGEFKEHNTKLMSIDIVEMCSRWAFLRWYLRDSNTLENYITRHIELLELQLCGNKVKN
jgi:AcrR family transcriptional regulator